MSIAHVVSHTHWDREWYLPAVRFRQLLVAMVDELLDSPPTGGASFLLDGQTVVIDDYLAVRPERSADLATLLRQGALEAGPWFVQADELIPCGESLVRNLLAGARRLRELGVAAPPVMYCPDTFGHPAALPTLANGFGCSLAIASRGYGGARWPAGDSVWWVAPSGERVLFYHLSKSGYETGSQLPHTEVAVAERWRSMRDDLMPRSRLGVVLLMNGADHHARQEHLGQALRLLADIARPDDVRASSLTAFARDIASRAPAAHLPEIRGELRDSYGWMWTLQGTFATRAHQKRRNAQLERTLLRDVEPWTAFAIRRGAPSRRPVLNAAWRSLLLCHPHDTICGCSTDEVARAMDARLDETASQASGIRNDALFDVIGHRAAEARVRKEAWTPVVVVRNRAARSRSGVALIRLTSFIADVKVGIHADPPAAPPAPRTTPAIAGASAVQVLSRSTVDELIESPRHYPDDDLVAVSEVAAWLPAVPAYGVQCFRQTTRSRKSEIPNPARADGRTISNGLVSVTVHDDGRVELADIGRARGVASLLSWDSVVDLGDLYTPSPRGPKFAPVFAGTRVVHRGPVRASIETRWRFRAGSEHVTVRVELIVDADARFVRVRVTGDNAAVDHRLRIRLATDVAAPTVFADTMFGSVEQTIPVVSDAERRMELPIRTAPLHRYVSVFNTTHGATVYSDGLGEYEADDAGGVFVTLVRAVGELSRIDLPERPGNAGWPTHTPGAQCPGPFAAELALMLHGARSHAVIDDIERTADDVLLPLTGATLRSALEVPAPVHGVALRGEGLAFATAKESDDGAWLVLRCANLVEEERAGSWTLGGPVREVRASHLDERVGAAIPCDGDTIPFIAPARGVVTLLVR